MADTKHTPGPPWTMVATHNEAEQLEINVYSDVKGYGGRLVAIVYGHTDDEVLANARLIAQAPTMLEALQSAFVIIVNRNSQAVDAEAKEILAVEALKQVHQAIEAATKGA